MCRISTCKLTRYLYFLKIYKTHIVQNNQNENDHNNKLCLVTNSKKEPNVYDMKMILGRSDFRFSIILDILYNFFHIISVISGILR
jgi:hypothetical protein